MNTRLGAISVVILALFFILITGLGYIQLVKRDFYYNLSEKNRIRLLPLRGLRGAIYDRNGELLAGNILSFDVAVVPQEVKNTDSVLKELSEIIDEAPKRLRRSLKSGYIAPFVPVAILENVERRKAFILEEWKPELRGIIVQAKPRRDYPYADIVSHITGYLGEIGPGELKRGKKYGYQIKDIVGRAGIERFFDDYLRGKNGGVQLEVDSRGRQVRTLGLRKPSKGKDIRLTIDIGLQEYISRLLKNRKGAVIVINPQNGEVLSMVSSPGYNPNLFIKPVDGTALKKTLRNPKFPLLNRALSGTYPAGSVFKIVVAAAGLESKKITARTKLFCPGKYKLGNKEFFCWDLDGHGLQTVTEALTNSCNVFFYKLGMLLGPDLISDYAAKFGLGKVSGIDLFGEAKGLVPNKNWKKSVKGSRWYGGDTVVFSIGQGYLSVTPIQIVRMIAVIANGGYLVRPYLVKKIGNLEVAAPKLKRVKVSRDVIEIIKEGLEGVVNAPGGTGRRAKVSGVELLAKTGTAQVQRNESHAWFTGFSPKDNSRVSLVVFLENGGSGGKEAAAIAGEIMKFLSTTDYL